LDGLWRVFWSLVVLGRLTSTRWLVVPVARCERFWGEGGRGERKGEVYCVLPFSPPFCLAVGPFSLAGAAVDHWFRRNRVFFFLFSMPRLG
jgi:hypothetical protein